MFKCSNTLVVNVTEYYLTHNPTLMLEKGLAAINNIQIPNYFSLIPALVLDNFLAAIRNLQTSSAANKKKISRINIHCIIVIMLDASFLILLCEV